jgi:beta-glucanase (GH16 family)
MAYQIRVSADGTAWTTIYSAHASGGRTETLTVFGTGRYVQVYGTARGTPWGYSLWELTVHTSASPPAAVPATTPPATTPASSPAPVPTASSSVPPPPGTGGDVLLSYRKAAVSSSSQDDPNCHACGPALAFDNDQNSRWATSSTTGWADPGWIYVDLGATADVHTVVLQWEAAFAKAYEIQVSPDAATWRTIYGTATGRGLKETLTVNGTGRYVRMYGTARGTAYGYSLWEFEVFGTGGNPIPLPAPPADVTFPATRLVFSDEFNGPAGALPEAASWKADAGVGPNNELEYYTDNRNAAMDGAGNLVLEARRETTPGSSCAGGPCPYTSARLNTSNSFTFTYGHVEARIKVSGTQGLWPAFWMIGANFPTVGWPRCGEIDIMEHVGKEPTKVFSTLHAPAYNGGAGVGSPYAIGSDFAAGFHTFAVDWGRTHMTFYVDGNAFFTVDRAQLEATRGPWVFDHPFYLVLNNAVGGDWPGPPDATTVLPQRMLVDYVRVYQ